MAPVNLSHRRTHNLLLISKLLSLRDTASPLTLLLDSLEQPATPLIQEYIRRAKLSKVHVTLVAFETLKRPDDCDAIVYTRRKTPAEIIKEVTAAYQPVTSAGPTKRRLIVIDAINPLLSSRTVDPYFHLPSFLGAFIAPTNPAALKSDASLVVTYHQDIPGFPPQNPYLPSPFSVLTYLATSIITLHSFSHILAQKAARDRSLAAPVFGLEEEQDGVLLGRLDKLIGTGAAEGIVLELEHRRKSGRGVLEWYLLPPASRYSANHVKEIVTLLDDNILYNPPMDSAYGADEEPQSTFELGLTDRQRRDREGVVLPYFDAQHGDGPGEGGRILYDMGEEDDFDEEEDEI
ncbi:Histone acetylation protein 2 [Penicillium pulvis]|uniref:Histone acetylation protein 2 n=1 Tax=Penicillium pulvis TaxID=1562058 RepID=UPI002546E644|nr:Histone acetylation protein 2 [Penicillium pulvis]KAJ5809285.1 Histone acetylation protein 2 [Penicillium pulvis]